MSFKIKNPKKIEDVMIQMVDSKHNAFVERFKEENKLIHQWKEECITDPQKQSKLRKKIKELEQNQLQYYLNNGNHLF